MLAKSPVVEGLEPYEIVLGGDQPEYLPLSVLRTADASCGMMSRWVPSDEERRMIAEGADVYLTLWTFGKLYPPTMIHVMHANVDADAIKEQLGLDTELNQRLDIAFAAELDRLRKKPEAKGNAKA